MKEVKNTEVLENIYERGGLKILIACSPIFVLVLNLGYYAYYQGYFYFFNINISYLEWNNFSIFSVLFWLAVVAVFVSINAYAFSVVIRKSVLGILAMSVFLLVCYLTIFLVDIKEAATGFMPSDVLSGIIIYIVAFILLYFLGIYAGLCVLWERRKWKKREEDYLKNELKSESIDGLAYRTESLMRRHKMCINAVFGLMMWLLLFFVVGAEYAKQLSDFKVVNGEYAVIYENKSNFLLAKIEDGKINTCVQKVIEKKDVEVRVQVFEGDFVKHLRE